MLSCPSLSLIVEHTFAHSLTRLTGENIHCQCEKWSGTDGIRMIETTYNGSHNFPIFLPHSHSCWRLLSPHPLPVPTLLPNYTHRLDASSQPLQCHPGSQALPKRLRLTGSPMALHKVSQEEKKREEGGVQGGEERWRKEDAKVLVFSLIHLAALFLAHRTFTLKYQWIWT